MDERAQASRSHHPLGGGAIRPLAAALGVLALLLAMATSVLATESPTLATDKPDYSPGEIVHITGAGFAAGKYDVPVLRPDGSIVLVDPVTHVATPGWGSTSVKGNGLLAIDYQLNGIAGEYEARAYKSPWSGDWREAPIASVTFTDLVVDFRQCANDDPSNNPPIDSGDCHWINSIIQGTNSQYSEGMALPQRVVFDGIAATAGNVHTLTLDHDTTKGGIHAFDFMVSYDDAAALAALYGFPYDDLLGQTCGPDIGPPNTLGATCEALRTGVAANHFAITVPDDPYVSKDGTVQSRINAYEAAYGNRTIDIYGNAPITAASLTLTHNVANGADTGDSQINYVLTWTSASTQVLITYATHISVGGDPALNALAWGIDLGAGSISGGPYHNNIRQLDGASLGAQDNQLKGEDLVPVPPTFETTSNPTGGNVVPGTSVTDTATINGSAGPGTGTIKFYLCQPNQVTAGGCEGTAGTQIGSAVALVSGSATSSATTNTTAIGKYCWRAEYTPAAGSPYSAATHTNSTTECFTVVKQPSTTATQASTNSTTVVPGTSVTDTATVTGIAGGPAPTGTVTFFLCNPTETAANGGDCDSNGTQVGGAIALVATNPQVNPPTASATSAATTATTAVGKYCWRAVYSGDAFYNGSNHTNGTTECFTVVKQPSTTATQASTNSIDLMPGSAVSDTATVTGIAGGPAPTGTVTFFLCQPADVTAGGCEGSAGNQIGAPVALVATNPQVNPPTASATSLPTVNTTATGTYCWRAVYSGDGFYNGSSHTNATTECFTVRQTVHPGTIGFWRNWRNHYTSTQFQLLINYLKTNNPDIYNEDLVNGSADDLTIAKIDAIYAFQRQMPKGQMVLAQFTALKLNLAITQLDGTGGLVQKNDDLCLAGTLNVAGIAGAGALIEGAGTDNVLTVQQVVDFVEGRWTGNLTTVRTDWTFNLTSSQYDTVIKVLTGMNEGLLILTDGCP